MIALDVSHQKFKTNWDEMTNMYCSILCVLAYFEVVAEKDGILLALSKDLWKTAVLSRKHVPPRIRHGIR